MIIMKMFRMAWKGLFTGIPVQETLIVFSTKFTSRKSQFSCQINLRQNVFFFANKRLIKKIDGCPMGVPISAVLSDIFVCKMEEDIVAPSKPLFYKRYVDDTYVRRKKNEADELYNALNLYHQNIKLTAKLQLRCTRK